MVVIDNEYFDERVKQVCDPKKCIYKQKPAFYIRLNNQLRKDCEWCPFPYQDCEICGGLDDILLNECYGCNQCGIWTCPWD